MDPAGEDRGTFTHLHLRGAAFARYFHAFASTLLVLAALALFFATEGEARRAWWELLGDVLGANGVASLFGLPILIAITARWRRAALRPFTRVDLDPVSGHVVVRTESGEVHKIDRERVEVVQSEELRGGRRRIGVTMRGGTIRDRYVLEVEPELADRVTAFFGPRRVEFDLGVRTLETAGWAFTLSYAMACVAAMAGSMWLRHHVPLLPFEPWSASESTGWILGFGAGAFGPTHALFAWWTAPPRITLGVDGLSVERSRGAVFHPWTEILSATAERNAVELLRTDGRRERIALGGVEHRRIADLARAIAANADAVREAAATASPEATPATLGAAYRVRSDDEEQLETALIAPVSSAGRRIRVAEALSRRGPAGRAALKVAALGIAERDLRASLERLAEEDVEEGAPKPRLRAR